MSASLTRTKRKPENVNDSVFSQKEPPKQTFRGRGRDFVRAPPPPPGLHSQQAAEEGDPNPDEGEDDGDQEQRIGDDDLGNRAHPVAAVKTSVMMDSRLAIVMVPAPEVSARATGMMILLS